MRQIATLTLAALVVAATVAAAPVAATHANATDAPRVATDFETDGIDERPGGLELTDFDVPDRELGANDTFAFEATYEKTGDGSAKRPVTLSVDGRTVTVGTLVVEGDQAELVAADWDCGITITIDGDGVTVTVHCGSVAVDVFSAGVHRVGMDGHDPVPVRVLASGDHGDQSTGAGDLELAEFDAATQGDAIRMTATFGGESDRAGTPLTATVDGERYHLGRLTAAAESGTVQFDPDEAELEAVDVEVDCDAGWDDGPWIHCEITITFGSLANADGDDDGDHEVSLNGHDPVTVTPPTQGGSDDPADGESALTVTDFEVADRTLEAGENLTARLSVEKTGEGPASEPLYLVVDGDRQYLGTLLADDGEVDLIETSCVVVTYDYEDPSLTIVIDFDCDMDPGSGTVPVGIDGLEPQAIHVEAPGNGDQGEDDTAAVAPSDDGWPFPCLPGPGPTFPTGPTVPCPMGPVIL